MKNLAKSLALFGIGPLIDDHLLCAAAVRDLAWPVKQHHGIETIKAGVIKVALLDFKRANGLAVAIGGARVELARASIGTIAVAKLFAPKGPLV
jgi:hypothetical protein